MFRKAALLVVLVIMSLVALRAHSAMALSSSIVISEIQTGGAGSGTTAQEFVELYNTSEHDINLEGWKVEYITASGATTKTLTTLSDMVHTHGYALLVTPEFGSPGDFTFTAALAGDGGHVRLRDADNFIVDTVGWAKTGSNAALAETAPVVAPPGGSSMQRIVNQADELVDTDNNAVDFAVSASPSPQGGAVYEAPPPIDLCPNILGDQVTIPVGYQLNAAGDCVLIPTCVGIELSEILANPAGSDTDNEYIELHNTTATTQSLDGCSLKVGTKTYILPLGQSLLAHEYRAFGSDVTGLTLTNTGGEVLLAGATDEVMVQYPSLGDDQTWALIGSTWQLTNKPTPNAANVLLVDTGGLGGGDTEVPTLEPCPAGKLRNPETNRCKTIQTTTATLAPCSMGEVRNPATNRCRKVVTATSSLVPCSAGQSRNPATNRCRKISTASATLTPCRQGYQRNAVTNRCRKVAGLSTTAPNPNQVAAATTTAKPSSISYPLLGGVSALAIGYGVYEYRHDFRNFLEKLRSKRRGT